MSPELPPEKSPDERPVEKPTGPPVEKAAGTPIAKLPDVKVESPAAAPVPPATSPVVIKPVQPPPDHAEEEIRRVSRRSLAVAGGAAAAGFAGWYWLRTRSPEAGIPWPLRRALEFNARLAQTYFKDSRLAPNYAPDRAGEPRVNGQFGFEGDVDVARWKLRVETPAHQDVRQFDMNHIRSLPRVEMVTELKCIEGWAQVVGWAGARFADFVAAHGLGQRDGKSMFDYVQLDCVGGGYYVGLDIASAMHPQTLLCYEMNGAPLTSGHGAPLRLVIPVKYGIKNIKRIGTIRFLDSHPADYWAERGYDWYAGL
jgi:DMSO/TMAO reductase YedYZ molybdopterin-dependent catalytic subunit